MLDVGERVLVLAVCIYVREPIGVSYPSPWSQSGSFYSYRRHPMKIIKHWQFVRNVGDK